MYYCSTSELDMPQRGPYVPENPIGYKCINVVVQRAIGKVKAAAKNRHRQLLKTRANPQANRDKTAAWRLKDPEKARRSHKEHHKKHRAHRLSKMREYDKLHRSQITDRQRDRRRNDPIFNLIDKQRGRIRTAMRKKATKKQSKTTALLGCTSYELHAHIAGQLLPGEKVNEMDVDHIFPCDAYDFTIGTPEPMCFSYKNLQPLPSADNRNKSNKLPTKAMASKVPTHLWPPGVTNDMLPDVYDGWKTPLRM